VRALLVRSRRTCLLIRGSVPSTRFVFSGFFLSFSYRKSICVLLTADPKWYCNIHEKPNSIRFEDLTLCF
jgi:hypothetical protein